MEIFIVSIMDMIVLETHVAAKIQKLKHSVNLIFLIMEKI